MKPRAQLALLLLLATGLSLPLPAAAQAAKKTPAKKLNQPSAADGLLRDAQQAFDQKDYAAAAELYAKFLADHSEFAYAHFQLGYAYTALKRRPEAVAEYRRAAELDPKMGPAFLNLALLLLEDDPAGAAPAFLKAIELLPASAQPHYLAGTALERSGNPAAAVEQYRQAEKMEPANGDYHLALARVLLAAKQVGEAESEFRQTIQAKPDYAPARLGLAQCLIDQQKLPEAAEALRAYLETTPADEETRLQLASVYADLKRYDEALKELDMVAAGAGSSTPAGALRMDSIRVDVLLQAKRYAGTVEPLRRLLAHAPGDATLHARLGRVLLELRDFPHAQQELVLALRLDPKLTDALRDLSSAYFLAENYPAALAAMDDLAKREEPAAGQWFIRALCYDKLHHLKEAIDAYQRFMILDQGKHDDQNFQARQRVRILSRELHK